MDICAMSLIATLDIPNSSDFVSGVKYNSFNKSSMTHFDRVGYFIELLSKKFGHQQLWVTFNPFSDRIEDHGIPSMTTTNGRVFQHSLYNVNIVSNKNNIVSGSSLDTCTIEYSPFNYAPLYDGVFDFNDQMFTKNGSYGCMQLFNAEQCVFAYNNFNNIDVKSDIGIGNNYVGHKDWTFAQNSDLYTFKRIQIYARNTFSSLLARESYFYKLCYSLDIPMFPKNGILKYNVDVNKFRNSNLPFDKIGYLMYLQDLQGIYKYMWLTCDAYTSIISGITIPTKGGSKIKKDITNINLHSNVVSQNDETNGTIVISPHNYLPSQNSYENILCDEGNYGTFQLYRNKKLLLAYNNFSNIPDIGIGPSLGAYQDYTFESNAHGYNVKRIEILTRPAEACKQCPESRKMRLLYSIKLSNTSRGLYEVDNRSTISKDSFSRIGYFLELHHPQYGIQYVWTSFEAFDKNPENLGLPLSKTFNKKVINFNSHGSHTDTFLHEEAFITFTPFDYNPSIAKLYETGSYGKMNIICNKKNIWSINGFGINCINDIGIGNCSTDFPCWTFKQNANEYTCKNMEVFVNNRNLVPDVVILLTGQSNSQGMGGFYDPINPEDQVHNNIYAWNIEEACWDIADLDNNMGTKPLGYQSLGFHFCKHYLNDHPGVKLGLIVSGMGGQSICRWSRPNLKFPSSNNSWKIDTADLYEESCDAVREALEITGKQKLDLILWHQGEADWNETHTYYDCRINSVINQYRNEEFGSTELPFICGELLKNNSFASKQNEVLVKFNNNTDPYSRCAFTKNFSHSSEDFIHFSSQGHRDMGLAYYDQFKMIKYWKDLNN
tara:strand:- start:232 stop:2727 length:2496 start_codon:yes stop_codon:yes gene_type:complete